MTLEQAQLIDQVAFWATLVIGSAAIAVIAFYEIHSRQKK